MYKAVYCSLCKYLGKEYGILSRLTLSYDFTFLALLNMSLKDGCENFHKGRCAFNPIKKCNYCENDKNLKMPAAAAMIMLYYKLLDNIADEKGIKKFGFSLIKPFFSRAYKKAALKYTEIDGIVKNYISEQAALEKADNPLIDAAADPTAKAMGKILSLCSDETSDKRILERLGYCIGRYIYILDAACDLSEDIKKKSYNVLSFEQNEGTDVSAALYTCANEAALAFELLDIKKFKSILGNIIYLGLEETFKKELNKE